jgi:ubiquinone/menaquinone biosynthesis C-methylase UbiE
VAAQKPMLRPVHRYNSPGQSYDWKDGGEEWSKPWGSSAAQWFGAILPRIQDCLPANTILEIAPGFGRWTDFLREHCERMFVVDFAEKCIDACRERFGADPRISYYVNDGRSLSMLPDGSVDFVFSFDAFVHIGRRGVEAYLSELGRKLKVGGRGFIHHSNLGEYAHSARERLPQSVRKLLIKTKLLDWEHHRTATMTAELFRELCTKNGLHCLRQELINWRGRRLIDCFSLFTRNSGEQAATQVLRNPNFMREAALIRQRSRISPATDKSST